MIDLKQYLTYNIVRFIAGLTFFVILLLGLYVYQSFTNQKKEVVFKLLVADSVSRHYSEFIVRGEDTIPHGTFFTLNNKGFKSRIGKMEFGVMNGYFTYYNEKGDVIAKCMYKNNLRHDTSFFYAMDKVSHFKIFDKDTIRFERHFNLEELPIVDLYYHSDGSIENLYQEYTDANNHSDKLLISKEKYSYSTKNGTLTGLVKYVYPNILYLDSTYFVIDVLAKKRISLITADKNKLFEQFSGYNN